jgi:phosphoglucomutase
MMAQTGKRIHELAEEMTAEFGSYVSKRVDLKLTPQLKETLEARLLQKPSELAGLKVQNIKTIDGVKLEFSEKRWLLFRLSGTEPVARIYAEACTPKDLKNLIDSAKRFVMER